MRRARSFDPNLARGGPAAPGKRDAPEGQGWSAQLRKDIVRDRCPSSRHPWWLAKSLPVKPWRKARLLRSSLGVDRTVDIEEIKRGVGLSATRHQTSPVPKSGRQAGGEDKFKEFGASLRAAERPRKAGRLMTNTARPRFRSPPRRNRRFFHESSRHFFREAFCRRAGKLFDDLFRAARPRPIPTNRSAALSLRFDMEIKLLKEASTGARKKSTVTNCQFRDLPMASGAESGLAGAGPAPTWTAVAAKSISARAASFSHPQTCPPFEGRRTDSLTGRAKACHGAGPGRARLLSRIKLFRITSRRWTPASPPCPLRRAQRRAGAPRRTGRRFYTSFSTSSPRSFPTRRR